MPLRDHFRPPVWNQASWEGFHGGWPMMMVLDLAPKLPKGFAAEPRVHLGTYFEVVDLVTVRRFNLYTELLTLLGQTDPSMSPDPPPIYAATCRKRRRAERRSWTPGPSRSSSVNRCRPCTSG